MPCDFILPCQLCLRVFLALRKAFVTEVSAMLGERALYQSPVMLPVYEHPTPEGGEKNQLHQRAGNSSSFLLRQTFSGGIYEDNFFVLLNKLKHVDILKMTM